jgi:hypothetical protein
MEDLLAGFKSPLRRWQKTNTGTPTKNVQILVSGSNKSKLYHATKEIPGRTADMPMDYLPGICLPQPSLDLAGSVKIGCHPLLDFTTVGARDALAIGDYRKKSCISIQQIRTISKHFRWPENTGDIAVIESSGNAQLHMAGLK